MDATLKEIQKNPVKVSASAASRKRHVPAKSGHQMAPSLAVDRKAALAALRKIGPVDLPGRK